MRGIWITHACATRSARESLEEQRILIGGKTRLAACSGGGEASRGNGGLQPLGLQRASYHLHRNEENLYHRSRYNSAPSLAKKPWTRWRASSVS